MPLDFNITVSGVDLAETTGKMKAVVLLGAERGLEKAGLRGVALVQEHTPVGATANLISGVFAEFHRDALMHEVVAVGPPADVYAAPVETGTRPHFPPPSALLLWVQKKLHIEDEKKATSVAFAIARTIAKRGTQGAHMFEQAFVQLQQEAPGIVEREIAIALEQAGFGGKQ